MPSIEELDEQVRQRVREMRREALQMLMLASDIEDAIDAGEQDYITDGDELVGFSFPQETSDVHN